MQDLNLDEFISGICFCDMENKRQLLYTILHFCLSQYGKSYISKIKYVNRNFDIHTYKGNIAT